MYFCTPGEAQNRPKLMRKCFQNHRATSAPNCAQIVRISQNTRKINGFRCFFRSPDHPKSIQNNRSKTYLKQAFQKAIARGRSGPGSCGPDGFKNRPSSTANHKTLVKQKVSNTSLHPKGDPISPNSRKTRCFRHFSSYPSVPRPVQIKKTHAKHQVSDTSSRSQDRLI